MRGRWTLMLLRDCGGWRPPSQDEPSNMPGPLGPLAYFEGKQYREIARRLRCA